jgi:urease accessory protein
MTPASFARRAALPALLAFSGLAAAHTGHDAGTAAGFAAGFAHPFGGIDHLLAMIAVGLWSAAALPAGRRWTAPALFLGAMAIGAVAATAATAALPFGGSLEVLIAASVLALGTLLALGARAAPAAGCALTVSAALLHGAAHGLEMAAGTSFAAYAAGFGAATALLHATGLGAGAWMAAARASLLRHTGVLIALAGLALLAVRA